MNQKAIVLDGISKRYRIGAAGLRPNNLREHLTHSVGRLLRPRSQSSDVTIWALQDVSFEVDRGEVVSIIGRNGSGKTTLLKVLSRVTEPTAGRALIHGRVGSLLEVGTGFHQELTGRENIYLNGAIIGMRRTEIDEKFDEIAAFAEVERFLDTPVKHYSSGMQLRLGFAVAAHLEGDVLLVDEALAVGDVGFQRKCLGKMGEVARGGRTVLFVSHDLAAVASLSKRAVLLEDGRLVQAGPVSAVIDSYLQRMRIGMAPRACVLEPVPDIPFDITYIGIADGSDTGKAMVRRSEPVVVTIKGTVRAPADGYRYLVAVDIRTAADVMLFRTHNIDEPNAGALPATPGAFTLTCIVPADLLPAGTYRVGILTAVAGRRFLQQLYPLLEFEVVLDQLVAEAYTTIEGMLTPRCAWRAGPGGG